MSPLTIWLRKISLLNTVTLKVYSDNLINLVAHMRSWTYVAIMTGMDFPEHRNLSPQFHEPHNRFLPAPSHLHCHSWSSGIFHTFLEEYVFCLCRYLLLSPPQQTENMFSAHWKVEMAFFSEVECSSGNEKAALLKPRLRSIRSVLHLSHLVVCSSECRCMLHDKTTNVKTYERILKINLHNRKIPPQHTQSRWAFHGRCIIQTMFVN